MSKKRTIMRIAFLFVFIAGAAVVALPAQARKLCCVAGKYEGFQVNYGKPNCPKPEREKFVMVIEQERGCGAGIKGTVSDSSGTVNNWTGTLAPGLGGCCKLEGSFLTPSGHTVKFKGTICRTALGKWKAKGTWEEIGSTDPCRGSGTWQMTQV